MQSRYTAEYKARIPANPKRLALIVDTVEHQIFELTGVLLGALQLQMKGIKYDEWVLVNDLLIVLQRCNFSSKQRKNDNPVNIT